MKKQVRNYYVRINSTYKEAVNTVKEAVKEFVSSTRKLPTYIAVGGGLYQFLTDCKAVKVLDVPIVERVLRKEYLESDDCFTLVYQPMEEL